MLKATSSYVFDIKYHWCMIYDILKWPLLQIFASLIMLLFRTLKLQTFSKKKWFIFGYESNYQNKTKMELSSIRAKTRRGQEQLYS